MSKITNKMTNKTKSMFDKINCYRNYLIASTLMIAANNTVTAANSATTPTASIVAILDKVIELFPAIGIVLIIVGAFKLFMAFRNDQPDAYGGAAKDMVIGIVCIIFKTFIWPTLTKQI